ncbi:hypothetical protein CLOM_g4308 [Closterium sp. NIES-68]|nr:hypothetical protein CLOM_g4308 [Closterium sp. NIES-68]GJP75999.1 hypothetical protein CLOP_g6396 [Closterium sp. NIES-67]
MAQSSCSSHQDPQCTAAQASSHEAPSLRLPPSKKLRLFGQQIQASPVVAQPPSDCSPSCDVTRSSFTSPTSQSLSGWSTSNSAEQLPPPFFPLSHPSTSNSVETARSSPDVCHVSASAPSLSDLGDDILRKIFQAMRPTAWDLCRLACVSTTWKNLCYSRPFWSKLRVGPGSMHPGMAKLAPRCRSLTDLFIDDPRCELHVLNPIIVACASSLRRVVVDCDSIVAAVAAAPGPGNAARASAESSICNLLWLISLHCRNVSKLELLSSRASTAAAAGNGAGTGVVIAPPSANTGSALAGLLESRLMWFLTTAFRGIRQFSCVLPGSMTTQTTCLMAIAWRHLASVRLHCGALQLADLLALRKCGALRSLELVGGRLEDKSKTAGQGPPGEGERLSSLEVLVLNGCDYDPATVARLAWHAPKLQRIVMKSGCRDITSASQSNVLTQGNVFSRSSSIRSSSCQESSTLGGSIAPGAAPAGGARAGIPVTPIFASTHAHAMVAAAAAAAITARTGSHVAGSPEWLAGIVEALSRQHSTGGTGPELSASGTKPVSAEPFAQLRLSLSQVGRGHVNVVSPHVPASIR